MSDKISLNIRQYKPTLQRGSVLLLALLIMSGAVATGLTLGSIVISGLRQSRNLDHAALAYYAAESGVEQALYYFRKDMSSFDTYIQQITADAGVPTPPQTCTFNSFGSRSCVRYAQPASSQAMQLSPGVIEQLTFVTSTLAYGYGLESLVIEWSDANPSNGLEPWLEMEVIEIGADLDATKVVQFVQTCGTGPVCTQFHAVGSNYFDATKNYKVRFRTLYDTATITVSGHSADNGSGSVIGSRQWSIYSTGEYGTSKQALRVQVQSDQTASSYANFVLFTECDLTKGFGVDPGC